MLIVSRTSESKGSVSHDRAAHVYFIIVRLSQPNIPVTRDECSVHFCSPLEHYPRGGYFHGTVCNAQRREQARRTSLSQRIADSSRQITAPELDSTVKTDFTIRRY